MATIVVVVGAIAGYIGPWTIYQGFDNPAQINGIEQYAACVVCMICLLALSSKALEKPRASAWEE